LAAFGFATTGELPETKIFNFGEGSWIGKTMEEFKAAKMNALEKLPGCTLVCRGVTEGAEAKHLVRVLKWGMMANYLKHLFL